MRRVAPGSEREIDIRVALSVRELAILERVMVERGVRQRAVAMRWALLSAAGDAEGAQRVLPIRARRRAVKRAV